MLRTHMILPHLAGRPVFKEHEVGRVLIVLVQVVLNAASFKSGDVDQLFKFTLHQLDLTGFRFDVGNDC